MNRVLRIAVRSLIFLFLDLSALTLLLSAVVVTPPVQRNIKAALEGTLSTRLGNQVTIGNIQLNWIKRLDLRDVRIIDREFGDSMTIRSISLRFALLPLLKKRLELLRVTIRGATVTGIRTKRGGLHFPFIPKHPPKVPLWKVTLGTVVVNGLTARYDDSVTQQYYALSGIKSRLVFKRLDSFYGTLTADTGEAITPWYGGRVKSVDIKADFSPKRLVVLKGLIKGDSSTVNCQGAIPFSKVQPWNTHVDVNTFLSPLLCARKIKGLQPRGEVHATASLFGLLSSPQIDLQIIAGKVMFDSIPVETAVVSAKYFPDGTAKAALDLASTIGHAAIRADAGIPALFAKPRIGTWNVAVTGDAPRLSDIANRFGLKHALIRGAAHFEAKAGGGSPADLPENAALTLSLRNSPGQGLAPHIECTANLENRQWKVDITADSGNRFHAQGAIGNRNDALAGTFALTMDNPGSISQTFLASPLSGSLSVTGDAGGTIAQPFVRFNLNAHALEWRGASIDRLEADAFYKNKHLYINRGSLLGNGNAAAILSLFNVKNAGGHYHIAAEAFGPIANPNISAEIGITEPHSGSFSAATLNTSITYRNDTLRWHDLRLGKNTAWIKSSGLASFRGKRSFANVSISAERHGYRSASGDFSAVSKGDSTDASVTVSRLDPGLLAPWVTTKVPLRGEFSLQAEVHGLRSDPLARARIDFDQTLGHAAGKIRYHAEAMLRNAELNATISAYPFGRPESLLVTLSAPLALTAPWTADHLIRDGARVALDGTEFPLGELAAQFMPEVKIHGNVSMHAAITREQGSWNMRGDFAGRVEEAIDSARSIHLGGLSVEAGIGGSASHPSFTLSATGDSLTWKTIHFEKPFLHGHGNGEMLYLDTAASGISRGNIALSGSVPWDPERYIFEKSSAEFRCAATAIPLAVLSPLIPDADISGGTLDGDATLTMHDNRPHLLGRLSVKGAGFTLKEYGQAVGPIDAAVSLRNDSVVVESINGRVGSSGHFSGAGYFEPTDKGHARFTLSATDCPLQMADLNAIIRTASLKMADSANGLVLGGTVTLGDSRYQLFLSPTAMFQKAPAAKPKKRSSKKTLLSRAALRVVVDLDKNMTIESNLGSLTLDGTVTVLGNAERPGIVGTISVSEGYLYYLDKKFTVQQGTFRFTNPDDMNPGINLTANDTITAATVTTASGAAASATPGTGTEYVVTLTITDSLRKPTVVLSSNPALQPEAIVSLITFGTTQGVLSSGLASAVEGLLAQQLAGFGTRPLQQLLNIESLNVNSGTEGTTVTAIKRISPRLSVTYQAVVQNLGKPNVSASYRLLPNVYIIGSGYYMNSGIDLHFRLSR
jgi:autotransporter translocation and assembly factor TamB